MLPACFCLQAAKPEVMGAGVDGNLCVYEVAHTYLPIKYLSTITHHHHPGCIAAAPDSSLLATVSCSDASPTVMLVSSALHFWPSTMPAVPLSNLCGYATTQFSMLLAKSARPSVIYDGHPYPDICNSILHAE